MAEFRTFLGALLINEAPWVDNSHIKQRQMIIMANGQQEHIFQLIIVNKKKKLSSNEA